MPDRGLPPCSQSEGSLRDGTRVDRDESGGSRSRSPGAQANFRTPGSPLARPSSRELIR
jgi:hypothetical protein